MTDEIECPTCNGEGEADCARCDGKGWCQPNQDELDAMAESQAEDRASGEPPVTMQEQYEAAHRQKRELRR